MRVPQNNIWMLLSSVILLRDILAISSIQQFHINYFADKILPSER